MARYSGKNALRNAAAGLAGLSLAFNLAACQVAKPPYIPENFTAADCAASQSAFPASRPVLKRSLTKDEFTFYSRLHSGKVDLKTTCIHLHEDQAVPGLNSTVAEREKNVISIFGRKNFSADYTKEKDADVFGIIAHATMHLAQHQNGLHANQPETTPPPSYDIRQKDAAFDSYSQAEQRSIFEDYVRFIFHRSSDTRHISNNCEDQDRLVEIVEKRFPQAPELRRTLEKRDLNDNEKALVLGIFGRQFQYVDQMTVLHHAQCETEKRHAVVQMGNGTEFESWTRKYQEDDYTKGDLYNFSLFVHETTHEWQNQTDYRQTNGIKESDYIYRINAGYPDFQSYHNEHQASIMQDYVRYFLRPEKNTLFLQHSEENLDWLKRTVENQFPTARKARLYFEKNRKLPDLKTAQGWLEEPETPVRKRSGPLGPASAK